MNAQTQRIAKVAMVSIEEALAIQEIIDAQYLMDWSEDSDRMLVKVIKLVQFFVANGNSWDHTKAVA